MSKVSDIVLIIKDVTHIAGDLMKCQVQQLTAAYKDILTRTLTWVLVVLTAILLAIGGVGMIFFAVYQQLAYLVGPAVSAYILGAFLLLLAVIIFLLARSILKE